MRAVPAEPCLGLIHAFEKGPNGSFAATRYSDPAGFPTIGWGHKLSGPDDPLWAQTLNSAEADALALKDLNNTAAGVCAAIPAVVGGMTEGQYAAVLDFAYNEGVGRFRGSTLCHYINTGNMVLAPQQFMLWVYGRVGGAEQVLEGLVARRKAEVAVWNTPS